MVEGLRREDGGDGVYRECIGFRCISILKQALELYDNLQDKIRECDQKIEEYLWTFESKAAPAGHKRGENGERRKNQPHFDLEGHLYRITGVDLTLIDGIIAQTGQVVLSE